FDLSFTAAGAIRLSGPARRSSVLCRGAKLDGKDDDGNALVGDGMKVGARVFFDQGFTAAGAIRLPSARVGGSVRLCPATLAGSGPVALDAGGAQITGSLGWAPARREFGAGKLEGGTGGD